MCGASSLAGTERLAVVQRPIRPAVYLPDLCMKRLNIYKFSSFLSPTNWCSSLTVHRCHCCHLHTQGFVCV